MEKAVEEILKKIDGTGYEVAIVGGAVRNILDKEDVNDWDLTTNAKPQEIAKLFKNAFYNNRFGTVGVPAGDGNVVEITTWRKEAGYSDRRHPDKIVWGKTLEDDLKRRDFTINAMALKVSRVKRISKAFLRIENREKNYLTLNSIAYLLIDPFDGQKDLKNKIIRTVGDPDVRFGEDALRILRAVRFATTLGFKIDEGTLAAIAKNAKLLEKISGERVRDELFKIIESENAADGVMLALTSGVLAQVLPELEQCFSVEQKSPKRHHIYDVGTHCVMSLKFCPSDDTIVRFATLLHDVGKAKVANVTEEGVRTFYNHEVVGGRMAKDIAGRLHISRGQREKLYKLVRFHQFSVGENQTDKALRRFIRNIGVENISDMMDLRVGDRLGGGLQQPESWRLKLFRKRLVDVLKKPFTVRDLKVNGNDVMKISGIKPGPGVGEILKTLFNEVLEDSVKNEREYLLGRIKQFNFKIIPNHKKRGGIEN